MRVLLTGASGELGVPLLQELAAAGHELVVLSRRAAVPAGVPGRWVQGDLRDPVSLVAAAATLPSAVVHMAAVTHSFRPSDYDEVNVGGTRNLVRALREVGAAPDPFVHLSTRAIGAAGGAYAASKERAEEVVRESGLPHTILRPAEVYGGGAPGSGGDDPVVALARSLQRRGFVPVLGDGHYELCPVHAGDVIAAVVAAVGMPGAGRSYVLAGPECFSYLELIGRIEAVLGLPRRRRVRVPLALARAVIGAMAAVRLGGFVPDQVPRLLLAKDSDSHAARHDLGFDPRPLVAGLPPLVGPGGR